MDSGFIYVVQMGEQRVYKIGRSSDVPRRMSEIGIQLPFPYRLLFAHRVPYCHYTESDLHRDFAFCRTNGEWFELSAAALEHVRARLLYAQAEWLTQRIVDRFLNDDLYPVVLTDYGRVFSKLGIRNERRLEWDVQTKANYIDEIESEDPLSAEIVI
jgi:hypothetical protein